MKTSAGTVKNNQKPIFLNRVSKPHVFSKMIHSHGAILKGESHKSIVPHQILHPDYDPTSPTLRVDYRNDRGSIHSSSQSRTSDLSNSSSTTYSMHSLPERKPYRPRAERNNQRGSTDTHSSCEGASLQENDCSDPTQGQRLTIMELERILIQQKSKLKKLQLETDASRKVYTKTRSQMNMKIVENQQKINKLMNSLKQARQNLESIQSTMPSAPVIRHRANSSASPVGQGDNDIPATSIVPIYTPVATNNTPFAYVDNGTVDFI